MGRDERAGRRGDGIGERRGSIKNRVGREEGGGVLIVEVGVGVFGF